MRILAHQRRRHSRAGPHRARSDRPRTLRRRVRRRAGDRPVGRRPFAVAQRSVAPARDQPAPLRGQGHADRLRHHGRSARSWSTTARTSCCRGSTAGRTSPRTSPIPGRSPARWRERCSAFPSIALSQAYGGAQGRATIEWDATEAHAAPLIRKILAAGIAPGGLVNVNFPALPARRGRGRRLHPPGPAQRRTDAGRGAPRRARLSLLLADVPARRNPVRGRHGPGRARPAKNFRHSAKTRPHRRRFARCGWKRLSRRAEARPSREGNG